MKIKNVKYKEVQVEEITPKQISKELEETNVLGVGVKSKKGLEFVDCRKKITHVVSNINGKWVAVKIKPFTIGKATYSYLTNGE